MDRSIGTLRLEKLYAAIRLHGLDAVALNPGPTLTYLTGLSFHLMERPVLAIFTPGEDPALVLPDLELLKVEQLPYRAQAFPYPEDPAAWNAEFRRAVQGLSLEAARIGVEPRQLRLLEYSYLRSGAPEAEYPDASEALASLRICKDQDEVDRMRRAVVVAEKALQATLPQVRIGMTEQELAAELTVQLLRSGSAPEMPFAPIVSAGPNSANPHAVPTDRRLARGDLLVVDWGATVDGYISDLTRTFAIGEVEPELAKIHAIVGQANAAGRAAAKPGVACAEVDRAARALIDASGYGQYFTHRTGHGIGMEGHEDPYMRGDNLQPLEPGMAFTVEPGIYLPGRGGVRIEDNVVITKDGAEVLSSMERGLQSIGS